MFRKIFASTARSSSDDNNNSNNYDVSESERSEGSMLFRSFTTPSIAAVVGSGDQHASSARNVAEAPAASSGFMGFHADPSRNEARVDRAVTTAARAFTKGVQNIVLAAKAASPAEEPSASWKQELLDLLGESTPSHATTTTTTTTNRTTSSSSKRTDNNDTVVQQADIDILLQHSKTPNFVHLCIQEELPPNLLHCLRLLRVLELQHAASTESPPDKPAGARAGRKVSRLLTRLCQDPSVGLHLQPHLFNFLALAGALYPPTGVHVAKAAADVICALAQNCLSPAVVAFIHDKKMILHMTDDVKDLAELGGTGNLTVRPPLQQQQQQQQQQQSVNVPNALVGAAAESMGLWATALKTIVALVTHSCQHSADLFHDFEAAAGYQVLVACLEKSRTPQFAKELMELLPQLAACPDVSTGLAVNVPILDVYHDLLQRSNPLLSHREPGVVEDLAQPGVLTVQSKIAFKRAVQLRNEAHSATTPASSFHFDMASELLSAALALFSEHPKNYEILEQRSFFLTYYILSFPCFKDAADKTFILKVLEFVLTGVGVENEVTPVHASVEIFFCLCQALLADPTQDWVDADATLLGNTLEKLLQFDQRVAPLMVESGILTTNLDSLMTQITPSKSPEPPEATPLDKIFGNVCRVLKLLVAHQPVNFTATAKSESNLHTLLRVAVKDLGVDALRAAAGVFEAYMSSFASLDGLNHDMTFVFDHLLLQGKQTQIMDRQSILLSTIRAVLEGRSLSRDSFRMMGGFDVVRRVLLSWKDVCKNGSDFSSQAEESLVKLFQSVLTTLDAAIGVKSRNPIAATDEASTLILATEVFVDPLSSRISARSPAVLNRNWIRSSGYYLDLAACIAGTGLAEKESARTVVELVLQHVDPSLSLEKVTGDIIRNPDAVRLVLGIILFLPESKNDLAQLTMDLLLTLVTTAPSTAERTCTALGQFAWCGLTASLTNPREFGSVLSSIEHPHHKKFAQFLVHVSGYRMSYSDFVGLLRCLASPLLVSNGSTADGRVRLPIISSAIKKRSASSLMSNELQEFHRREEELCLKLQYLCDVARCSEDGTPRVRVGGDTINSIAVLMHKIRLADRLRAVAEEGRLKFLEIERINAAAASVSDSGTGDHSGHDSTADGVWTPLLGTGFTYCAWMKLLSGGLSGNIYILDIASAPIGENQQEGSTASSYLSLWYDLPNQRFNILSSISHRSEPICFPVSPLAADVWHHVMLTYTPAKRTMMARKSIVSLFVDGRPLEAEVKVDSVTLPPNARLVIGAPNASLAVSSVVRGAMPVWELGPIIMLSAILLDYDAAAIFCYGPRFPGLLWGDRPQRLSLAATATATFTMLVRTGETGSIASALRRRDIGKIEKAGYSAGHSKRDKRDDLSSASLLCRIPPECVIFGFLPGTATCKVRNTARRLVSDRLVNLAKLNFASNEISTDAVIYGKDSIVAPLSFADNLQWVGGPEVLMPLVNAANSSRALALTLEMIRESSRCHQPNLQMLQVGGGYRVLGILLQEKPAVDERCLDQCLAFAIHGFVPEQHVVFDAQSSEHSSSGWVLVDLDAMKHLLLNHRVWDLRKYGPEVPLRLLWTLNRLVDHRSVHKAFNARRLHQVGIVRWTLHLMIEACELYMGSEQSSNKLNEAKSKNASPWVCDAPLVTEVCVGGDPGNPFLLECKNLLRRVLTFMLTPGDLGALAEASIFTVSITSSGFKMKESGSTSRNEERTNEDRMLPSSAMRLHLVRLLEELIVDGVNEIVASQSVLSEKKEGKNGQRESVFQPHSGGVASPGQPYFSSSSKRGITADGSQHPKHQQAQAFLSAFAGFLTPVWFATLLEGSREEASSAATMRLMILLLQGSATFESAFREAGGFTPFVLSVPRYSTSPGLAIAMLSQLLNVPILHLHALPSLDPEQLCELFDAEGDVVDEIRVEPSDDPSSGIFALLAECIGRNIRIAASGGNPDAVRRAIDTNLAIMKLLSHRFDLSEPFRVYCFDKSFLVPLAQSICSVIEDTRQYARLPRAKRRSVLSDIPKDISPTERFIGAKNDSNSGGMGLIRILRRVLLAAVKDSPGAALAVRLVFQSFPIHATPLQVEAFHLIIIENCCSITEKVMEEGGVLAVANCVGICSVLLDQMINSFLNSEAALHAVQAVTNILDKLVKYETSAVHSLANIEHTFLTMDAAHYANIMVTIALRISFAGSHPKDTYDKGDEDLQAEVLSVVVANIESFLLLPSNDRRKSRKIPTGKFPRPSTGSKMYPLWQSASLTRLIPSHEVTYPDLSSCERPDVVATAPLLVMLHRLLLGERDDVRSLTISVLIALLKHRPNLMSSLLVAEMQVGDQIEKIDVVNRGGFRALLVAHEADSLSGKSSPLSVQRRYSSFFEWFERHNEQVCLVFDSINAISFDLFPSLRRPCLLQSEAIEEEQKRMLVKLTAEESDRTIIGGLERSELCRRCNERTAENHFRWKRQGFDDLAFGAMKLKVLMRRLKGSCSLWEGGSKYTDDSLFITERLTMLEKASGFNADDPLELVRRWKLDLTEGYERQRRRLLPNYEFHGLYNLDELHEEGKIEEKALDTETDMSTSENDNAGDVVELEATAALLKDLNLKRTHRSELDLEDEFWDADDGLTVASTATGVSSVDATSQMPSDDSVPSQAQLDKTKGQSAAQEEDGLDGEANPGNEDSYELVIGLLHKGDWPTKSYNVRRCTGLEVTKALFLSCKEAVYIIDGFEQTEGDKITRVEREQVTYSVSLRQKGFKADDSERSVSGLAEATDEKGGGSKFRRENSRTHKSGPADLTSEVIHQHRCQRIPFAELYAVYRRRYQLLQTGLEFFDIHKNATLIAFENHLDREDVLTKVLNSNLHPDSIFSGYGSTVSYAKTIGNLKAKIIQQWVNGRMTNFDFIMQLNNLAGRSFNDLTQYPVFPWIIADYESEEINLDDPNIYRDLSRPMGALGEERAQQFRERYEALESTYFGDDDPPPFHYGTHFSSAAYTLYYLMRLEPFSRLALALQGGRFDVADRLFHDIGRSWKSASSENLQDVRELIPEFFYLPDFLVNSNDFDFGETQRGKTVHDVTLPKWAKGDPSRFIRINRQALESSYVSQNLHHWVDLVFGCKQRSVEDLNVFVHVTYEGEVDLDNMTDPVQRASTIAQIQNFGQTPSKLERKPFPARNVSSLVKESSIDFSVLSNLITLTPPLCVCGAPHVVQLQLHQSDTCKFGLSGQTDRSVGDLCLFKGQAVAVGRLCSLMVKPKKFIRFGGLNNGISIHTTSRGRDANSLVTIHDGLHRAPITYAKASLRGDWIVTGSVDSTVRVWKYDSEKLEYMSSLCAHDGHQVKCLDISTEFNVIVSGSDQGKVLLWDLRTLSFVRRLAHGASTEPVLSVSINNKNGNIVTLVGTLLSVFDVNGGILAQHHSFGILPTCAVATDCPEWLEGGIVAVTGHLSGDVCLWQLEYSKHEFVLRHQLENNPHTSPITALRVDGIDRQDHLLVGDSSGKTTLWKSIQLETLDQESLAHIFSGIGKK